MILRFFKKFNWTEVVIVAYYEETIAFQTDNKIRIWNQLHPVVFFHTHILISYPMKFRHFPNFSLVAVNSFIRWVTIEISFRRDVFQVATGSLGDLQKIQIRNDDTGDSPDWFIEKVNAMLWKFKEEWWNFLCCTRLKLTYLFWYLR